MFTDIVGYTALMGSDEEKAFEVLRKNRSIQRPIINKYNGKWLKEMGDGILASFNTASEAVRCAIEIQQSIKNEGIELRIGIHTGEVVFEGGDVLGDGVNVASRLEEMAEKGCIYVSGAVYKDIKNKAGINAEFISEKKLKNVEEPIKVYDVNIADLAASKTIRVQSELKRTKSKSHVIGVIGIVILVILIWKFIPSNNVSIQSQETTSDISIAVIPFWNDSPDPDNDYFCKGMEVDIRSHLSTISNLQVEPRLSVEKYRQNPEIDLKTIAEELNVKYIVTGSARKIGDDVKLIVELIDANNLITIWDDDYNGSYSDELLTFQSITARKIALELDAVLTPEEELGIDQLPTSDMMAYDFMMRGRNELYGYWHSRNTKQLKLAHKLIDKALEIDPQYRDAIGAKGGLYIAEGDYDSAYIFANRILDLNPESAQGYGALGEYYRFVGNGKAAIENYELALKYYKGSEYILKSHIESVLGELYYYNNNDYQKGMLYIQKSINDADSFTYANRGRLGLIYISLGDYEKADKYNMGMLKETGRGLCWGIWNISMSYTAQGRYKKAINFLDSICSITVCESSCTRQLFWNYVLTEQFDQAEDLFKQYSDIQIDMFEWDSILLAFTYKELNKHQEAKTILNSRKTSLQDNLSQSKDWFTYIRISMIHALLDEKEKSMQYLSSAVELGIKYGWHDFLPICPIYKEYWDDPDFKVLVKRSQEERAVKRKQVDEMIERGEINL
jgi:adenylate cyclase